ncbi:Reverse transcriptase domain [Arabidopsis suecica]|uniref:Reverse transcriptase domain n=1 Tax=Arabidopsis suecica TaxID=45249 RepID=A0A8T2BZ99_ARASU|nr:Reverse transcriptase domain [Arabidopsis suecica]
MGKWKPPKKSPSSKSKAKKKGSRSVPSSSSPLPAVVVTDSRVRSVSDPQALALPRTSDAQSTVSPIVLDVSSDLAAAALVAAPPVIAIVPVKVDDSTEPGEIAPKEIANVAAPLLVSHNTSAQAALVAAPSVKKKGVAFTLESGEACVKIPNSIIERNRKSWDCFVLGQFYSDPPAQGTLHNIVNGIWSKQYRDIAVSKMEGNAFLFRIPNAFTRSRVLNQRLWQIDGLTMFVANWEPGVGQGLWADWHKTHHIKNNSFWALVESPSDQWTWKMLLRLRPLGERFLKTQVGNGHKAFFWFDNWTPFGPLIKLLGLDGPKSMRIRASAKVSEACNEVGWLLPSPRSDTALKVHTYLTTVPLPTTTPHVDHYFWAVEDMDCAGFSSSKTWEVLRPREEKKPWVSSVWFRGAVPKHAFNMWVSTLNRLPTRQRLASWGVIQSDVCCLCAKDPESRDHLLISCDFASAIWSQVFSRLSPNFGQILTWNELLSWTRHATAIGPSLLRKVAAQATIYHIWRQRNNVLHNDQILPPSTIFKIIDREIRNIITVEVKLKLAQLVRRTNNVELNPDMLLSKSNSIKLSFNWNPPITTEVDSINETQTDDVISDTHHRVSSKDRPNDVVATKQKLNLRRGVSLARDADVLRAETRVAERSSAHRIDEKRHRLETFAGIRQTANFWLKLNAAANCGGRRKCCYYSQVWEERNMCHSWWSRRVSTRRSCNEEIVPAFSVLQRRLVRRRLPAPVSPSCPITMGKWKPPKKSPSSKSKAKKKGSRSVPSSSSPLPAVVVTDSRVRSISDPQALASPRTSDAQSTVSPIVLDVSSDLAAAALVAAPPVIAIVPVKVDDSTEPGEIAPKEIANVAAPLLVSHNTSAQAALVAAPSVKKKGVAFTLESGEACVKIPNSIIERNRKSWDCFVLGQFYSDPPAQGTLHNIVNGIWSKQYRDIDVSKMEGNAFLFRIPNAFTRSRVLNQRLWQIDGLTMFVANWEPGVVHAKPELTLAPIWLELRNVPLQFFHEEGLECIAGLVGDPKFLHPSTSNKTNLEVAKVFTLIDPRKPLPEAVNVQFDSGQIQRVLVSSPWMPPICGHCKGIGHSLRHCKAAPVTCIDCQSTTHLQAQCPKLKQGAPKKRRKSVRRRTKSPSSPPAPAVLNVGLNEGSPVAVGKGKDQAGKIWAVKSAASSLPKADGNPLSVTLLVHSEGKNLGSSILLQGESSSAKPVGRPVAKASTDYREESGILGDSDSEVDEDSSDISSSESEKEDFTKPKEKKFISALLPGWSFAENYSFSILGKIWVLWDPCVQVVVVAKSLQMITCEVLLPDSLVWLVVSIVYASNDEGTRKDLWKELVTLATSPVVVGKPWIVLGDFNQTLNPQDLSAGPSLNIGRRMRDFRSCLLDSELFYLVYKGSTFTWWNKCGSRPVARKIDRVLVNDAWTSTFSSSYANFGEPDFSDHASCEVVLDSASLKIKRPFRFFNYLLLNQDFIHLIREQWYSCNFTGSAMYRVSKKLKHLKPHIRSFSRDNYSDLEKRVAEAHALVLHCQKNTLSNPSTINASLELAATKKWHILAKAEESYFCQKSSVSWLLEGDSNTAYFHKMADMRKSLNTIRFLYDDRGERIDSQQGIKDLCSGYFQSLLGGEVGELFLEQNDMNLLLTYRCSQAQISELESFFSPIDIQEAFFSLPRNKTSGPDGFSAEFFKGVWSVVGPEVVDAVQEFFRSGQLLKQWNATTLILIPKIPNASALSDFRPISCLNTIYKVIARLLTSRLQKLLSQVISPAQSAFLPGRLLAENVLLATEIVHGYNWRNIESRGMLKVDLRKAFDSVRWDFIISALRALSVPERFVNWIYQCISTASFSVSVNGSTGGFFKSTKGLRQGDPLSPYLFVLAMEVFSNLLKSRFDAGYIHYHPKTSDLSISHLMFADDVMVFFDGGSSSLHGISETLDDFASWSGLQVNKDKTTLYLAGTDSLEALAIARYGFPLGTLPVRYLGLPLMSRKLKISEYEPLMEKVAKRFRSWAVKSLSFAGRVQLIASVITGIVNFWMSTFILPLGCVKKIESLCSRFLWSGNIDSGKGAKIAWSRVCLPKCEGGVGLRRFSTWNKTLCLRFLWLLFAENGSLSADWHKTHHIKNNSFWALVESPSDQWTWKMLLRLRPLGERFLKTQVGNGHKAFFWFDNWTPFGPLIKLLGLDGPKSMRIRASAKVSEACNEVGWLLPSPRSDTALKVHTYLTTVPLPTTTPHVDHYFWAVEDMDCAGFSSSKTWEVLRPREEKKPWVSSVWFRGAVPKHAFNMWVSTLNRLPTRQRLASWGVIQSDVCCLCAKDPESRDHLLISCDFASAIWSQVFSRLSPNFGQILTWNELLSWTRHATAIGPSLLRKVAAQATIYHIWRQRNNVLHNDQILPPSTIFKIIDREIRNIITVEVKLKLAQLVRRTNNVELNPDMLLSKSNSIKLSFNWNPPITTEVDSINETQTDDVISDTHHRVSSKDRPNDVVATKQKLNLRRGVSLARDADVLRAETRVAERSSAHRIDEKRHRLETFAGIRQTANFWLKLNAAANCGGRRKCCYYSQVWEERNMCHSWWSRRVSTRRSCNEEIVPAFSVLQRRLVRRRLPAPVSPSCPITMGKWKPPKKSPSSKSKAKKKGSRSVPSSSSPLPAVVVTDSRVRSVSDPQALASPRTSDAQSTVSPIVLDVSSDLAAAALVAAPPVIAIVPVKVDDSTEPGEIAPKEIANVAAPLLVSHNTSAQAALVAAPSVKKKGVAFTLESGEACVKIPNSIIERNRKSWDCFVLGQFYSDPPAQGTLHNIVNGIWSKQYRDIAVSKMEGNAFLFRIPNAFTRSRVLNQRLWQIDGLTMFVANWEPGVVHAKPELTSAPIWLELRNVPLQFFHEEGLECIAGLVGDPKFLHPSTANKTNLEVAKVFTLIDPRKPLPEAVNVQFDSGQIQRVLVSSPWMPPICGHCKGIGHSLRHCKAAPVTCIDCQSTTHLQAQCPKLKQGAPKKRRKSVRRRSKSPSSPPAPAVLNVGLNEGSPVAVGKGKDQAGKIWAVKSAASSLPKADGNPLSVTLLVHSEGKNLGSSILLQGESSSAKPVGRPVAKASTDYREESGILGDSDSEVDEDSSDISSSESEKEDFTKPKEKKFISALLPGWSFAENYSFSILGKIWVLWDPCVQVVVVAKSLQMITCEVLLPDSLVWLVVSIVYASNDEGTRKDLWKELVTLATSPVVVGKPWIVLGDFNQTLNPQDLSAGPSLNIGRRMRDFRSCLLDSELFDLVYKGSTFTWWNKCGSRPVARKIDRVLVNDAWTSTFSSSYANFGEPDFSDHASCEVVLDSASLKIKRPFRFFNYLLVNQDFIHLIREQWYSCNFTGSAMYRVSKKLKHLKPHIRSFSRDNYSDLEKRVAEAHALVLHCQKNTLSNPSTINASLELAATKKWHILAKAEESYFCQKSSVSWLLEGDSNTAYFHKMADMRKSLNTIRFLYDDRGERIDSQQGIKDLCSGYFQSLLGGEVGELFLEQNDMNLLLTYRCSQAQISELESFFSPIDIQEAFFSLPRNKTSGPDGFSAEFFKGVWSVVGPEVVDAVQEFFRSGQLLKQWNATTLILIPKIPNASALSDFRPISCLNTIYKVIARLLTSRLQKLLSQVISPAQSAFLPGRLLAENVLLATEIVHGYNWRNIESRGMLKVDLRKAFDSVRWDFIISALRALSVPERFVNWIYQCISTASFSVSVNGSTGGFFKSTKGLRQGDPLSPYLFVLAMEVFSNLLKSRFDAGYIHYHPKTSDLSISHLMFADDVMVFFDGGSSSLHGISETLDDFASWSGLQVNKDKTTLYLAGTDSLEALAIARYGFPLGTLPVRYLGLPLMSRKLKISEYEPLMEKVAKRFRSWAVKSLSFAGRVQLIASVITGIVNFWMSTFILPLGCVKKIESLCSRFLWSGNIDSGKGAKIAWSRVCLPKCEGGVGLRRFSTWNKTLCLRFLWLLFAENGSLSADWHKTHHIKNNSFWALVESPSDQWTWKMLLRLRPLGERFLKTQVGNGHKAFFWFDNWTPFGPLIKLLGLDGPKSMRIRASAKVSEACNEVGWLLPSPRSDTALKVHTYLTTVPLPTTTPHVDHYFWAVEDMDCAGFSSSKTWEVLRPREEKKPWVSSVWFRGAVPKHAFNMWVSTLNRLPTRQRLASWGVIQSDVCCLCAKDPESRDHLLISCDFASAIWSQVFSRLSPNFGQILTWNELLSWTRHATAIGPSLLRKVAAQATIYHIWRQRNNVLHNDQILPPSTIFKIIDREIRNIITGRRRRKRWRPLMILWIR